MKCCSVPYQMLYMAGREQKIPAPVHLSGIIRAPSVNTCSLLFRSLGIVLLVSSEEESKAGDGV